jgi:S-adenosylmethionine/arginine decarboxylase-like enzyme
MPFGYHLMLDLYRCDKRKADSIDECYRFLDSIPEIIKTDKQCPPYVVYTDPKRYPDKAGISGWVAVVESGISIHTITPVGFISIDIYTCGKIDEKLRKRLRRYVKTVFKPKKIEEKFVLRGEKYKIPNGLRKKRKKINGRYR